MKKSLFLLFFSITLFSSAQDSADSHYGSIKVSKKGVLHSVLYDDVNFRLVCRDIYGNIHDSAVVSFTVNVSVKGIAYTEKVIGPVLSKQMQQKLSRMDGIVTLFFSNIKAKDKNGRIHAFPNFKSQTGTLRERTDY
jgi:hypothetical protein